MNRFEKAHFPAIKYLSKIIPITFFAFLLVLFLRGVNSVSATTDTKQLESLETALQRTIAQCYAVEGAYPENVNYLTSHYGLTYDHEKYIINYTYYGSNIYPEYIVLPKTGKHMIN